MLGPYLDKGMESARRNVQAEPFMEETRNFTVRSPFAPQLTDQFAVGFELRAIRFVWERFENCSKVWFHWIGSRTLRKSWSDNSPITRSNYA